MPPPTHPFTTLRLLPTLRSQIRPSQPHSFPLPRYLTTPAPFTTTKSSTKPSKPEPTIFASKAVPRQPLHERPEAHSPMPPGRGKVQPVVVEKLEGGGAEKARETAFDGPSRPRMLYERPKEARELPKFKYRIPLYAFLATVGAGAWGLFLLHATNSERLASSPLRQITFQLRNSPEVQEVLGDKVRYAANWWGFGEPWIAGTVNLMQGRVDLKFRIEGSKGPATVYFTSLRPAETSEFQIVRYKVVADDGTVILMKK